ncbi:MAG: MBL fold metallo-hydrolase [Bacillota bacterium]|nr:MBL fold metallo-hydrolase [Bacillota bacterium]
MIVHSLRIPFHVTKEIVRFVNMFVIEGKYCYLVDTGVAGCEKQIEDFFSSIGRSIFEIKGIFLTHAHPDHIGTAYYFREKTGCLVYASGLEKSWIEDIDLQFSQRPIPNFYVLAGHSCLVDRVLKHGDVLDLEEGIRLEVIDSSGHSTGQLSYRIEQSLFVGDSIPLKEDIPIWVDLKKSFETLTRLEQITCVDRIYPAWDVSYNMDVFLNKIEAARNWMEQILISVKKGDPSFSLEEMVDFVCKDLAKPYLCSNPLFRISIESCLEK